MWDEGFSELFRIVINIFGEVKHNRDPNIVRSDLHIAMTVVGLEKGSEEAIIKLIISWRLASSLVCQESRILYFP